MKKKATKKKKTKESPKKKTKNNYSTNNLPEELKKQLTRKKVSNVQNNIKNILDDAPEPLTINEILIDYYRETGNILKRTSLITTLSMMTTKKKIKRPPNSTGIYESV